MNEIMIEYARLLRAAWLNPSWKPFQKALHDFERKHEAALQPLWIAWQEKAAGEATP